MQISKDKYFLPSNIDDLIVGKNIQSSQDTFCAWHLYLSTGIPQKVVTSDNSVTINLAEIGPFTNHKGLKGLVRVLKYKKYKELILDNANLLHLNNNRTTWKKIFELGQKHKEIDIRLNLPNMASMRSNDFQNMVTPFFPEKQAIIQPAHKKRKLSEAQFLCNAVQTLATLLETKNEHELFSAILSCDGIK